MKKNSLKIDLNTINKQLTELSAKVDAIDDKIIHDNWFKIISIVAPILVGILVFYLTRKKEILFKKAEVAGEIFMRIYELKKLKLEYQTQNLNKCAFEACLRLPERQVVDLNYIKYVFQIDENDKPKQTEEKIDDIAKELMKFLGQYKFYLNKKNKAKLHQKAIVITLNHQKYELFENCNSVDEILNNHEKISLNDLFNNSNDFKINETFAEIEKLISK
jgi:hypothetical protein